MARYVRLWRILVSLTDLADCLCDRRLRWLRKSDFQHTCCAWFVGSSCWEPYMVTDPKLRCQCHNIRTTAGPSSRCPERDRGELCGCEPARDRCRGGGYGRCLCGMFLQCSEKLQHANRDSSLTTTQVSDAFRSQPRIAGFLYCCAGGNHAENGFFIDLQATQLDSCMKNNYYSTAYAAKAMLDIWVEDDKKYPGTDVSTSDTTGPKPRRIVFANSAAAFLGLPGSVAYTRK